VTALHAYLKLESTGLWRAAPEDQRRDVFVMLGDASLVISDKSDKPLAHWSLPALERLNPGAVPALFLPGPDASETLEIDDPDMIAAIETVQRAVLAATPKPGRLRLWIGLGLASAILAGTVFWLPGALVTHAERVVPASKRAEIGERLFDRLKQVTGAACGPREGSPELRVIARRIGAARAPTLYVVPELGEPALSLPGGITLLDRALVENHDSPAVAAGYALAAMVSARQSPPMSAFLDHAGMRASILLLTRGEVEDAVIQSYAGRLLNAPRPLPDAETLLAGFEAANIPSEPFARAVDITGETTLELIEADPYRNQPVPEILPDNSWVALQSLCDGG